MILGVFVPVVALVAVGILLLLAGLVAFLELGK
jgi:hypothetical protein